MAKRNSLFTIEQKGTKLTVTYSDGKKDELDTAKLSQDIRDQGMYHGFKQKLADSAASAKGDLNYAKAAIGGVIEALAQNEWNRRGGGAFGGNLLAEAVARVKGYSVEEAREKLAALTDDERDALKKAKPIVAATLAIKAERLEGRKADEAESDAMKLV